MMYVALGNLIVYLFMMADPSNQFISTLIFDRGAILQGQIWRLITYIFVPPMDNIFFFAISLFFYFQIGKILENSWGVFRFNLYYFSGIILTNLAALVLNAYASAYYLNMSLILAFATCASENQVYFFGILPIKMKYIGWLELAYVAVNLVLASLPGKLFIICSLLNFVIFMGSDIKNLLPGNLAYRRPAPKKPSHQGHPNWAAGYHEKKAEPTYRHKCTVCGKTDTQYPDLEFRYCSLCDGYHCYCMEHINNHVHIKDHQ